MTPCPRPTDRCRHGFSLIELLVVIAILAILTGLLVPAVSLVKSSIKTTQCSNHQRQLFLAILAYASDEEQALPAGWNDSSSTWVSWDDQLVGYDGRDLAWSGGIFSIEQEYLRNPDAPAAQRKSFTMYGCPEDGGSSRGPWVGGANAANYWPRTYAFPGVNAGDPVLSSAITVQTGLYSIGTLGSADWAARMTTISQPSAQILLCERLDPYSILGRQSGSVSKGAFYQNNTDSYATAYGRGMNPLHRGKWNYLFADGHIELLDSTQTVDPSLGYNTLPGPMWRR